MAENKDSNNISETVNDTESTIAEKIEHDLNENDALKSFLERDTVLTDEAPKDNKPKKLSKNIWWIIIGCVAVLVVFGIVTLLNLSNSTYDDSDVDHGTEITLSVDENNVHQAELVLNKKGELENNSYGTLINYTPSDVEKIEIENESGSYTISAETPIEIDEESGEETQGTTIYTLVGYENSDLQSGSPDAVADVVCALGFTSVADITGENATDFGFDNPRAVVNTTFTDGTTSTITVGANAPSSLGTYIMFGDNKTIYVVESDTAEQLLISAIDLVSLTVNSAATDTDNSEFESITLEGTAFDSTIEIRPNDDSAIDSSYVMISPDKMFVSETEASSIAGAIRGLYADEVVCVNPSNKQLKKYSLDTPYAKLTAVYPDTTIHLSATKPKDNYVYLYADSDVIYKIATESVPWVNTSYSDLVPDIVIDPNFNSLTKIEVTDTSGTYAFDVTTTTDTVTNDEGVEEEVSNTTAIYNGETLDENNFYVFYQDIANIKNAGNTTDTPSGKPVLTIKLSYNTGRDTDVIKIYPTNNSKYIATLNGKTQSLVYKSYCTKFSQAVQDLISGETVSSF